MVRTQIRLTDQQYERARRIAHERGVSLASVIRQALDGFLSHAAGPGRDDRRRPMLQQVGAFDSGVADVSREHDRELAEAYRRRR